MVILTPHIYPSCLTNSVSSAIPIRLPFGRPRQADGRLASCWCQTFRWRASNLSPPRKSSGCIPVLGRKGLQIHRYSTLFGSQRDHSWTTTRGHFHQNKYGRWDLFRNLHKMEPQNLWPTAPVAPSDIALQYWELLAKLWPSPHDCLGWIWIGYKLYCTWYNAYTVYVQNPDHSDPILPTFSPPGDHSCCGPLFTSTCRQRCTEHGPSDVSVGGK